LRRRALSLCVIINKIKKNLQKKSNPIRTRVLVDGKGSNKKEGEKKKTGRKVGGWTSK